MKKFHSLFISLVLLTPLLGGCFEKKEMAQENSKLAVPHHKTVPKSSIEVHHNGIVSHPESIPVLVNKQNKLPESYQPDDLVDPNIPFIFAGKSEKRKMRAEAAAAIEDLFAGALKDGVKLLGVSAYRPYSKQKALFQQYVRQDGVEAAKTYSALPGTSEHETGLAIDVTGGDGKCAAEDCFSGSKEAKWIEAHAAEYGFIIRYPKGKEAITGYQYEPWHLRYVGKKIAADIMSRGITLEEYYR